MAVDANTSETYANTVIKEDLQDAYNMISPTETPFITMAKNGTVDNTLYEWPVVELAAAVNSNRVVEGEATVANDAPTLAVRLTNYTQISDKTAQVSHTAQAVDAAAENVQRMGKQIVLKMKELKRDMETMMLSNLPAVAGSSGNARTSAGFPTFLKTNVVNGAGGGDPTLSGGTSGFPNAAATVGAITVLLESQLNEVIEACWNEGASPSIIMVNGGNKRRISAAFTGNSTRQKDAVDKKIVAAIDFYDSDFGELTVVPNRFQPTNDPAVLDTSYNVYVMDPEYVEIAYLEPVQQKPLAETGHSIRTLVWAEYGLKVENEKAHGIIRDTKNTVS